MKWRYAVNHAILGAFFVIFIGFHTNAATTVTRGNELFYITSDGSLAETNAQGKSFILVTSANLKDIYLFQNRFIVGLTNDHLLYMLAPNEWDQECVLKPMGRSFFSYTERECNWVQIGYNVAQVFVDDKNILAVYAGAWKLAAPTLVVFKSPTPQIYQPTAQPLQMHCGLGCLRTFGASSEYRYPFENLEIINFEKVSYNQKGEIQVTFKRQMGTFSLEDILAVRGKFKSQKWYQKLIALQY
jgi:hypothetical protein